MLVPNDNTMSGLNGSTGTNGARFMLTIRLNLVADVLYHESGRFVAGRPVIVVLFPDVERFSLGAG